MYKIEFVELDSNVPFVKFLELKNRNLAIKENLSKYLDDGIYEIRVSLPNKIVRNLYYYVKGQKVIITHGFVKKSQKVPKSEINKAKDLRKKYNERMSYE